MPQECFFFDRGGPLLCDDIRRDGDSIVATVINGAWKLRYTPGLLKACNGSKVVTEVSCHLIRSIPIPPGMRGDYNARISWAEEQLTKEV